MIKGKSRNITIIISAYGPTNGDDTHAKNSFYNKIREICHKIPKYDMLLVLGDFIAQIGKSELQRQEGGPHTLHEQNNYARRNKVFIRSTYFKHKNIHL